MLNLFHQRSQEVLVKPVVSIQLPQRDMRSFADCSQGVDRWAKSMIAATTSQREELLRDKALANISERRRLVYDRPHHEWGVYELCKAVYELSEIDQVDFNGVSKEEKIVFIRQLVPCVTSSALQYGVEEYHDSRAFPRWPMDYTKDHSTRVIEGNL